MPDLARRQDARLVVFTPLPPLENGIADYAAEILPLLAAARPTTVVIDDQAPTPPAQGAYEVIRLADYSVRQAEFAEADHLYQAGNNPDHIYLMPWLLRRPGIVVLHDVSLHHLMDQATLRYGDVDGYGAVLELEYGATGRLLAQQFERHRWRTRSMFFELPLTRELLARAKAVIVHSLYAANKVVAQQPDVAIELVRHHVARPALDAGSPGARARARQALDVADDTVLLVSLGFVTRAKQIDVTLRFLHEHRAALPPMRYIIAGQDSPEDFDVRSLIRNLDLDDIVEITGYVGETDFYRYIAASDIVVNLRYPSGGETSGTLIRALGAGACLVVNDIGSFAEYPDDVCAKVPVEEGVSDADFERVLLPLVRSPAARQRLSRAAGAYMRRTHSIDESARRYLRALRLHRDRAVLPLPTYAQQALLGVNRREALLRDVALAAPQTIPLWAAEGLVPCAIDAEADRVLLAGGAASNRTLLARMFGYRDDAIVAMTPTALERAPARPSERRAFGMALLEPDAGRRAGLAAAIIGLNARLRLQGHLVLTLATEAVGSDAISRVRTLLEDCGFVLELAHRSRETLSFVLDAGRPATTAPSDAIALRARKISEFVSPRAASTWNRLAVDRA